MTTVIVAALVGIVCLLVGILAGYIIRKNNAEKTIGSAEIQAKNLILDAENKSENIRKEALADARAEAHQIKLDAERDIRERRDEVKKTENRLIQKEATLDKKTESIERKEEHINRKIQTLEEKEKELDGFRQKQIEELEKISGLTSDEAKQLLLESIEKDVRHDASLMIRDIESKAKEEADSKAKEIIVGAIQRCAADYVAETTVSVVPLPSDEMKGRIIGREGRNIR
ncbi:MAG: DUF3552 domain-containing protein, partial [Firmicutes bacterium]|nr:DUF3552 domain-containing protein [Bacillota bacterium]MCF0247907.1 DUF3552 domain-containing protein [Synergistes sp.]